MWLHESLASRITTVEARRFNLTQLTSREFKFVEHRLYCADRLLCSSSIISYFVLAVFFIFAERRHDLRYCTDNAITDFAVSSSMQTAAVYLQGCWSVPHYFHQRNERDVEIRHSNFHYAIFIFRNSRKNFIFFLKDSDGLTRRNNRSIV